MKGYRSYFKKATLKYYPAQAEILMIEIERQYEAIAPDILFASGSPNPIDRRLGFCGYFLALIISLEGIGVEFFTIRQVCLEIVTDYVRPKNKAQEFIKRKVPGLINTWLGRIFIENFKKRVSKRADENGFRAMIITGKEETLGFGYGVDILECGICKLFAKHGSDRYAPILCEVDEITSGMAGLKLLRTGTIANGATKCDFRYLKNA